MRLSLALIDCPSEIAGGTGETTATADATAVDRGWEPSRVDADEKKRSAPLLFRLARFEPVPGGSFALEPRSGPAPLEPGVLDRFPDVVLGFGDQ